MGLLNYTTKIDPDKTAQEIARCLSSHGASAVLTEYDKDEQYVSAISFKITVDEQSVGFRLPCDWKPVQAIMFPKKERNIWDEKRKQRMESEQRSQAIRTAWRIVKDWVEAQMALVETRMVNVQQVFLPYAVMKDGRTLAEHVGENPKFLSLGSGN
jgi:hypothetical protein